MSQKKKLGQAVVEYLFFFALVSLMSLQIVKGLRGFFGNTMASLGVAITQQLSSGVCPNNCFFGRYKDGFDHTQGP